MSKTLSLDKSALSKSVSKKEDISTIFIAQARQQYATSFPELEIDDDPKVSISKGGAWVAAWVWVSQEETELTQKRRTRTSNI